MTAFASAISFLFFFFFSFTYKTVFVSMNKVVFLASSLSILSPILLGGVSDWPGGGLAVSAEFKYQNSSTFENVHRKLVRFLRKQKADDIRDGFLCARYFVLPL